jgi:hypothetical protein
VPKIVSFLGWQIAAVLFVEAVLFSAGIGEEEIFKFDKKLGFRHFPNKLVTWRSEGYARSYFDADGMREPGLTIEKPANTLRVALLGDSEVESLQVPIEKTYGQLIEKTADKIAGKKIQVLNFGNSGYSTTQECLLLEDKVFKYQPDLVILGYTHRDMFENWAPPDATLSNVRPSAIQLPGKDLIIDNATVLSWWKTPRARFLQSIEWLRQNSRVWGIIAASELQLSMKEPFVKAVLEFSTNPSRSVRAYFRQAKQCLFGKVSEVDKVSKTASSAQVAQIAVQAPAIPTPQSMVRKAVVTPAAVMQPKSSSVKENRSLNAAVNPALDNPYTKLLASTMAGLIDKMRNECSTHHSQFIVVAMPCRADLAPLDGVIDGSDLTFEQQIDMLRKLCAGASIKFVDANAPARSLPLSARKDLFIHVHLAPAGHEYMRQQLLPAVEQALRQRATTQSSNGAT